MSRVATIILNRNLPEAADHLVSVFRRYDCGNNDVYVVESGSDHDKLSRNCTWWADWPEAIRDGLRYPRGFNFGLAQLVRTGKFQDYDYFLLCCNDLEFDGPMVSVLVEEMRTHPKVGIMTPCGVNWAERDLIGPDATRYAAHGNLIAWMLRRSFVEAIMERQTPDFMNFIFDGNNFRGYYAEQEIIIKGYINEFATAITTKCLVRERTELLKSKFDLIRTDRYEISQRLLFEEGREWMRRKYGFSTRYQMNQYAYMFFDQFFHLNPHLAPYKIS